MTTNSHTPAPWVVEPRQWDQGASLAIISKASGYIVALVPFDEDIQTVDEPNADTVKRHPCELPNANILAASCDLLEAGQDIIASWEEGDLAAAVRKLDRAIAKARGRK